MAQDSDSGNEAAKDARNIADQVPWSLRIPDLKDVLVGELGQRGNWVVAQVKPNGSWPVNAQMHRFKGCDVWIIPITNGYHPAVAVNANAGGDRSDIERVMMNFVSALSWINEQGISVEGFGGGSQPVPMGRENNRGYILTSEFDFSNLPEITDERRLLALALMREGRSLNHPGYAFLSLYRVLEVALPDGRSRGAWIDSKLDTLEDHRAKEAVAKLKTEGTTDIGTHLLESGRKAIAHAKEKPVINPDNPSDLRRLWSERPIITSLAATAIEEILGIETGRTIYRKHLYELAGFKELLKPGLCEKLAQNKKMTVGTLVDLPRISVRLRGHPPFKILENLSIDHVYQNQQTLVLLLRSADQKLHLELRLNFGTERLEFDMFRDIGYSDTGTAEDALAIIELNKFLDAYFCNGRLEVYNAESNFMLSRKDAYLPHNMRFDGEAARRNLAELEEIVRQRRAKESGKNDT